VLEVNQPATPADILAAARTIEGAERHDDVELHFVVNGQTIYTREQGDYLVVPLDEGDRIEMSDLTLTAQRWPLKRVEMIDGGAWACNICGFVGEHYMSLHAAQQAGAQHLFVSHGLAEASVELDSGPVSEPNP
jgi:hypothetical protein